MRPTFQMGGLLAHLPSRKWTHLSFSDEQWPQRLDCFASRFLGRVHSDHEGHSRHELEEHDRSARWRRGTYCVPRTYPKSRRRRNFKTCRKPPSEPRPPPPRPARSLLAGPFHADPEREKGGKREQNKKDAEGWACGGQRRSLTETGPRARAGWGLNFRPAWGTENHEESSVRLHKSWVDSMGRTVLYSAMIFFLLFLGGAGQVLECQFFHKMMEGGILSSPFKMWQN